MRMAFSLILYSKRLSSTVLNFKKVAIFSYMTVTFSGEKYWIRYGYLGENKQCLVLAVPAASCPLWADNFKN